MSETLTEQRTDGYSVRRYRPADRDAFLSLYGEVFGKERSPEWFAWRWESPYLSEVPMVVAELDGELVGALPFIAFRLRAGLGTVLALQPADAMVHADHRRHGLLTRMTEHALEYYEPREPSLLFNFPNDAAAPAFLDLGWVDVGRIPTYYRVQNAGAFVGDDVRTEVRPAVERLASACSHAYLNARDRSEVAAADVRVERHDAVPGDVLAPLYDEGVPNGLHAPRDAEFYGWRFENPHWERATYVARRNGTPVAGIVVCTQSTGGTTVTKLMEAVPMTHQGRRREAFGALLSTIVRDHRDADAVAIAAATLPHGLLTRFGFHRDDVPPLSWHSTVTRMVARPLVGDDASSTVRGFDLGDADHWSLTFAEQDTSY